MQIKDFYNVRPDELEPGDVLVCTVTLHVSYRRDGDGKPMFRMYRAGYPPQVSEGIPQGSRLSPLGEKTVAYELFPVVGYAGLKPD
jgi:hypothetical protein